MWDIEYYESPSGKRPVEGSIDSKDTKSKAQIARTLDLLEQFGIDLGMPYARYLGDKLWELRIRQGRNRYRIIYFLHFKQKFILLHGFSKKTSSVPITELEIAAARRTDYLARRGKRNELERTQKKTTGRPQFQKRI